jgi:hypothetical protein
MCNKRHLPCEYMIDVYGVNAQLLAPGVIDGTWKGGEPVGSAAAGVVGRARA